MKYLPLIFILLAGCSVDNPTTHSYTEEQTDEGTGLVLLPSENMWISFPQMVSIYVDTEACMGMTAPAPTVRFLSIEEYFNGALGAVWAFHTQGHIYMNTDENPAIGIERDERTDSEAIRHEYIHSILWHTTGNGDTTHTSSMFQLCGIGVNTYN